MISRQKRSTGSGNPYGNLTAGLQLAPALLILTATMAIPMAIVIFRSFSQPEPGLQNYVWFFESATNVTVLIRTFAISALVAVVCLLFGYPYAYAMTAVGPRMRMFLMLCVLVPFWVSGTVRTLAWVVILQNNGVINTTLKSVGLDPLQMIRTQTGVVIGMTQVVIPFVILPLYSVMKTIDLRLVRAATSMGAPPIKAFLTVYLPLSLPGVFSGGLLAFILSLGFYITPALLGGPRSVMLSTLVQTDFAAPGLGQGRRDGGHPAGAYLCCPGGRLPVHASAPSPSFGNEPMKSLPIILGCICVVVAIWLVAPTLVIIPMSFNEKKSLAFPPSGFSLQWYANFRDSSSWWPSFVTSLKIAVLVSIIATAVGTLAALGLRRLRPSVAGILRLVLMSPMIIPGIVLAIGIYAVYLDARLVGTMTGFVLAHTMLAIPFVMVAVGVTLEMYDTRLTTAAISLGAAPWQAFQTVTLPLIAPGVLSGALFAFVTSFDEVVVALFISDPYLKPIPVQIYASITRDADPTVAAVGTIMFVATTLVIAFGLLLATKLRKRSHA